MDAAATIRPAVDAEPDNPFVLNEYARALFRVDSLRLASGPWYERLATILTERQSAPPNAVVVDMWFTDAYWKLALLYLDVGEYAKAFIELARVALTAPTEPAILEQLYGYLAEASYYLGEHRAASWFIRRTLEINPENRYVQRFRRGS